MLISVVAVTAIEAFMSDIQHPFWLGCSCRFFRRRTPLSFEICIFTVAVKLADTESVVGQVATGITRPWLEQKVQQLIEEDGSDPEENLILYGLNSLRIMQFSSELKAQGINIGFEELGRTPTLSNWWSLVDVRARIAGRGLPS